MTPATAAAARRAPARSRALPVATRRFYRRVLAALHEGGFPFLVGGGHALEHYLGIGRSVKDLDLFMRARDAPGALAHLERRLGLSHRAHVSALARQGQARRARPHRRHLELGQLGLPGGRRLVPPRGARDRDGAAGPALPGRGDDLVQGLRDGARALRRRRHRAPHPRARRADRLEPPGPPLRPALARAAEPPDPVRLRLPVRAAAASRSRSCGAASRSSSRRCARLPRGGSAGVR